MLINNDVQLILQKLENFGFEGYIVGGAVRNYLLNIPINDYDIATNATPDEVKLIFQEFSLCLIGQKHYTIGVIINRIKYEITSYRTESQYIDYRHPQIIEKASSLKEDLSRRDFTINAMAYNGKIIDYFGGLEDINNKIIRCVNDPLVRFEEDALRIMRALRFSCCLGFKIENNTKKAIFEKKQNLSYISRERINDELFKMIDEDGFCKIFEDYYDVFSEIIPFLEKTKDKNIIISNNSFSLPKLSISILYKVKNDFLLKLSSLFIGIYYIKQYQLKGFKAYLKDLKFSNKIANDISIIVYYQFIEIENDDYSIKKLLRQVDNLEIVDKILFLKKTIYNLLNMEKEQENINQIMKRIKIINKNNECYKLSQLAINGNDLIKYGIKDEKEIGKMLNLALDNVTSGKIENNKDNLYNYLSKKILN